MAKKLSIPLAGKIVGITAILVAAALFVLIIITSVNTTEHVFDTEEHNLEIMTDLAEDLISSELKTINYEVILLSENENLITYIMNRDIEGVTSIIEHELEAAEFFSGIFIADKAGNIIASHPNKDGVGVNIKEIPQWNGMFEHANKEHRETYLNEKGKVVFEESFSTEAYKSGINGNTAFAISAPTHSSDKVVGVLIFEVDVRELYNRYLDEKTFGKRGYPYLGDYRGNFVTHKKPIYDLVNKSGEKYMSETLSGIEEGIGEGIVQYKFEGEDKFQVYNEIDYVNWFIAFTVYDDDLTELAEILTGDMILVGAISLVLLVLLLVLVTIIFVSKPINRVVVQLTDGSNNLESASQQIAASSQQLSSGNSELAASIEEITSSLEELQSVIELNTKNINESELLMKETNTNSQKVSTDMKDLSVALDDIGSNSEEIVNIIGVIEDIAFQTNILALNAAVEAGRAGEAGSGFAVVADQVKELAQKSSESAKETAKLIKTAIESISRGQDIGKSVKDAQEKTSEMSTNVTTLLNEVNRASKEQMKGVNQITQAVTQTNSVVQQTAASAEETAAASEELLGQSEDLNDIVDRLNIVVKGKTVEKSVSHNTKPNKKAKERTENSSKHNINDSDKDFNPDEIIPMNDEFKEF